MASCPLATLNSILQRHTHPPPRFETAEIPRTYHTTLTLSPTTLNSMPPHAKKVLEKICKAGKKYVDGPGEKAKAKRAVAEKVNEVLGTYLDWSLAKSGTKNCDGLVGVDGVKIKQEGFEEKGKRKGKEKTKALALMSGALPFEKKARGKDVMMIDDVDGVSSLDGRDNDEDDVLDGYESGEVQVFDATIEKNRSKAKARPIGAGIDKKKRNPSIVFLSDDDDSVLGGYESDHVIIMDKKRKRSVDSDGSWASKVSGAKRKRIESGDLGPPTTKRKRSVEEGLFVSEDESVVGDESMQGLEVDDAKRRKLEAVRRKIQAGVKAAKMRQGLLKQG
ncbi:hypothetical protein AC578_4120 [Pseudocercospora eumusae]|uniref:Uncharacterized protein n=1 Tax=Pseudocercospora eumusae TaxID=321146 RepID=A0A139HF33_9PEZI|nr:hypothetical protein AC578_4120 [Pseudocercospora eumusae]